MAPLTIIDVSTDDATAEAVGAILRAYNTSHVGQTGWVTLRLIVRDEAGVVQAGLLGHTAWSWCFVDTLAVAEAQRKTGIGTQLLQRAESIAKERGCIGLYLWTTSFQAPEFYKRQGYTAFGHLPDMPPGHATTWFMKRF